MKLTVTEGQPREHGWSKYEYIRFDKSRGLHAFTQDQGETIEWFAKHKPGIGDAGWHLRRGAYIYEFVTSARA